LIIYTTIVANKDEYRYYIVTIHRSK